jgi:hypothetical protein
MTVDRLKEALDDLSWDEQMDFEMSERPGGVPPEAGGSDRRLRAIAAEVTVSLLDALEQEAGYAAWALRLSPYVAGDRPASRARRFLNHPNRDVRQRAEEILRPHSC